MCVRFNKDWLPYVLGGLFQLVNPSSWLVDDEPSLQEALERATALLDLFGQAGDCPPMDLRFTDGCVLQYSLDGGTTWLDVDGWTTNFPVCNPPQTQVQFDSDCLLTESFDGGESFEAVPGWAANFKDCVVSNAPIIGLPPNPGDELPDQFACSIAAYLADQVILLAMQKAVNAIQDDLTLLVFGANVLTLIPEFILVAAAYDAFASIYGIIAEGTLSHYEDAIADETLWQAVTCAIYKAIRAAGYVTPGNFGAILTNLASISYTHSDVVDAIVSFVTSLGATGLAQLSQRAGLLVGSDCSSCIGWCKEFDFTASQAGWGVQAGVLTSYTAGVGWTSISDGTNQELAIWIGSIYGQLDSVEVIGNFGSSADSDVYRRIEVGRTDSGTDTRYYTHASGLIDAVVAFPHSPMQSIHLYGYGHPSGAGNTISKVILRGTGIPPVPGATCE